MQVVAELAHGVCRFQLMQIEAESEAADAECPLTGCGQSYKNSQVIELAPEEGSVRCFPMYLLRYAFLLFGEHLPVPVC